MWIENNDLELMNSIFETEELIPRNRKGGLKLRHISFFFTNTVNSNPRIPFVTQDSLFVNENPVL